MEAKSERAKKMTRDVVIGALGSMLVGAAFTALSGSDDWGRNMLIYGGIAQQAEGFAEQCKEEKILIFPTVLQ